jgi:ADP-L-glycero-D-manno-heptose 6-epimerase
MIVVTGAAGFHRLEPRQGTERRGEADIIAVDNLAEGRQVRQHRRLCRSPTTSTSAISCACVLRGAFGPRARRLSSRRLFRHDGDGRPLHDGKQLPLLGRAARLVPAAEDSVHLRLVGGGVRNQGPAFRRRPRWRAAAQCLRLFKVPVRPGGPQATARALTAPVVGLRYFNVYGPREAHKGRMASVAFHQFGQFRRTGKVRLFEGSHGYANGEQRRDFIHVDDVVAVNLHFLTGQLRRIQSGNGACTTFQRCRLAVVNAMRAHARDERRHIAAGGRPGPDRVRAVSARAAGQVPGVYAGRFDGVASTGYKEAFQTVEQGTASYVRWLLAQPQ